mgnify:CR=1 FL=1
MARKKVADKGNVKVNNQSNNEDMPVIGLNAEIATLREKGVAVGHALDELLALGRNDLAENVYQAHTAFVDSIDAKAKAALAEKETAKVQGIIDALPKELRGKTIIGVNQAMQKAYELVLCLPQNTPRTKAINGLMLALLKGEHKRMTLVDICNETGLMPSSVRGHFGTSKNALNNNGMTQRGLRFVVADKQPVRLKDKSGALHVLGK